MAIQNSVTGEVIIAAEGAATFGTAAAAAGTAKKLRRVSISLALGKDAFQSAEVRADQQVADMRHGTKRPGGGIEGELCNVAYDDLLEALLRGTWTAGAASLTATYTTIAFAVTSGTAGEAGSVGTMTWAAGDPVTAGHRVGDVVRVAGFDAANNARTFRIVSLGGASNRTVTVTPAPTAVAAAAGTSFTTVGRKLLCGTTKRSFSVEQSFPDLDISELYTGMRVGGGAIRIPPNGMASVSFSFMGQDMVLKTGAAAPYFTATTAAGTDGIFAGPTGALRLNGKEQGIVTAVDINVDLGLSADPVVGRTTVPEVYYGVTSVSGSVSAFLEDESLINAFINESEIDLVVYLQDAATVPNFLCFNMQRIKLGGATKTVGAGGGVIVTFPYTALLASAAGGKDASTLVIQRSNA